MEKKTIVKKVHHLDASGQSVGRLASQIAILLRGKNKPEYVPHIDDGDVVDVKNVAEMTYTGKKIEQKKYYRHSQHPGGLKITTLKTLVKDNPAEVLQRAVREMLPPTRLRPGMLRRLIIR
jgi:large subunit ribosomal protein L13